MGDLLSVQTSLWTLSGYQGIFHQGKAAGAWRWPLTFIYCQGQEWVELYLYFRIYIHGVRSNNFAVPFNGSWTLYCMCTFSGTCCMPVC